MTTLPQTRNYTLPDMHIFHLPLVDAIDNYSIHAGES